MATLKYKGSSHFRVISAAAFKSLELGGDNPSELSIAGDAVRNNPGKNPKNVPFEVEVADDIAEYLLKNEKADWGKVAEKTVEGDGDAPASGDAGKGEKPVSAAAGKGK